MNKSKTCFAALISSTLIAGSASADLLIYEPFDYEATTELNNDKWFGDGDQAGGLGLGAWQQLSNGSTTFVNEGDVADEGVEFTDSLGNVLPVGGFAYERRNRVGQVAVNSPIDPSATTALTADNSTMWMTFLFQDFGFSGPDFGIGLHSEKMIGNDNQDLDKAGHGVGFSIVSTGGQDRNIGTAVYNNAANTTLVSEATATFNGPEASEVFLLAMKVNWNPSGTPDEIFVFIIDDITTEPDEADALAMDDTFDFDLATQQSLDILNFSDTQVGYVDEIRIGTTFGDVTNGASPPAGLAITDITYIDSNETNEVALTWNSKARATYIVRYSTNLVNWDTDLEDGITGDDGSATTRTFNLSEFGLEGETKLFFRVEEE
ncbi:hypothetical protein N9B34_00380 [Akkermansiaceae bacterium]|jgi:hypothetical protein|nr:hypothetical protein [Akkermansiaceae bacterium]